MKTSEREVNLICYKWKDLFESINRNKKLYLRKVVKYCTTETSKRKEKGLYTVLPKRYF